MFLAEELYISLLDEQEIKRKIEMFGSLDLSLESEERIKSAIFDIISVEYDGKKGCVFRSYLVTLPEKTRLYRVRKNLAFLKNPCEQDFWENETAPINRFNKAGERVLYVSENIGTPLEETGVRQNEYFVLIEYSNIQSLSLSPSEVGNRYGNENSDNEALKLLNGFISKLARLYVGSNERHLYRTTNALADIINSLPTNEEETRDGMLYVSAHTGKMSNLVIKSSSLRKLSIKSIWIAKIDESSRIGFSSNIYIDNGIVRFGEFQRSSVEHLPLLT